MSELRFSRRAEADLDRLADHIRERNPRAAARWVDRIEDRCRLLADNPLMGRARFDLGPELRSFAVGRYLIFYRPLADGIMIMRVLHGSQDLPQQFQPPDDDRTG